MRKPLRINGGAVGTPSRETITVKGIHKRRRLQDAPVSCALQRIRLIGRPAPPDTANQAPEVLDQDHSTGNGSPFASSILLCGSTK